MNPWFLLFPILSAVIGWLIHVIASRLIFYPVKPLSVLGFKIQGFIPATQPLIADQIAEVIAREFSASSSFADKLSSSENLQKVMPVVETHIDNFLRNKLQTALPMIAMFVGEKTIQQLKTVFMSELELIFPEVMQTYAAQLGSNSNISLMVKERLENYPSEKFTEATRSMLRAPIKKLQWLGAISGFVIGLILLILLYFMQG